ncbi:MAG: HAD hydrolase-like protein, partial [Candidatus Omnitrophica bacterium]|nr:HAD hydrolase-like protein [Candidatus Omnitrophota bacterium]
HRPDCRITVTDVSPSLVAEYGNAIRQMGLVNVNHTVLKAPCNLSAIPSASYDVVYANRSIQYFDKKDLAATVRHLYRILKPGGLFFLIVPDKTDTWSEIGARLDRDLYVSVGGGIRRFYESGEISLVFPGFDVVSDIPVLDRTYAEIGDPHVFGIHRLILRKHPSVEVLNKDAVIDMRYAAFDFDGTLVDTEDRWQEVEMRFFTARFLESGAARDETEARALAQEFRAASWGTMQDKRMMAFVAMIRDHGGTAKDPEAYERGRVDAVNDAVDNWQWPNPRFPGITGFLDLLGASSVPYCIATSARPVMKVRQSEVFGLGKYFNPVKKNIFGSPESKEEILKKIMKDNGYAGNQVVMFGDNRVDIRAAKAAGCISVAIAKDAAARGLLIKENPDIIINGSYDDLRAVIQALQLGTRVPAGHDTGTEDIAGCIKYMHGLTIPAGIEEMATARNVPLEEVAREIKALRGLGLVQKPEGALSGVPERFILDPVVRGLTPAQLEKVLGISDFTYGKVIEAVQGIIHDENMDIGRFVRRTGNAADHAGAEKKVLWHVIVNELIPEAQEKMGLVTQINRMSERANGPERIRILRKDETLKDVLETLAGDPFNTVHVVLNDASRMETEVPRAGDIKIAVMRGVLGTYTQLEAALAVSRALDIKDRSLRNRRLGQLYTLLTGKYYTGALPDTDDARQLALAVIFDLPKITVTDYKELERLNNNLLAFIRSA